MKLLMFFLPTIFALKCEYMDYYGVTSISYQIPENSLKSNSSIQNPGKEVATFNCTVPTDKCFGGYFLTKTSPKSWSYVVLKMCQSEAVTNLKYYKLNANINCNQKMPYYYNSTNFEYIYQCCNKTDCDVPDLPDSGSDPADHKNDKGAASTVLFSLTMLLLSTIFVAL